MNFTPFESKKWSENISRKIENENLLWGCVSEKKAYIPYLPPRITLITSKRCNLACRFCYHFRHKYFDGRSPLNMPVMDTRLLYKIAEELFPTLQYYETTLLGDPFLSPLLKTELELAGKYDAYMRPTTNGTTLTNQNIDLVSGHLDWLKCSFDSHIRGVYNSIRIGARFDNTIKKLRNFVKRREEMRPWPYFRMGLVMNDLNLEEIPEYFLWCHEYMGVDDVEIMGLNVDADHIESLAVFDKASLVNKVLDRTIALAMDKKYKLRLDFTQMPEPGEDRFVCQKRSAELRKAQKQYGFIPPENFEKMSYVIQNPRNAWEIGDIGYVWSNNMRDQNICVEFMNRPFILDNGNVEACGNCNTYTAGNMKHQQFSEIWNTAIYKYVRSSMYGGKIKEDWPDACNDCICMGVTYDRGRSDHRHRPFYRVTGFDEAGKEIREDVGGTHGPVDFNEDYPINSYVNRVIEFSEYERIVPGTTGMYLSDLHDCNAAKENGVGYDKINAFTPLALNGKLYSKGLYCEAPKDISFSLPQGIKVFKAVIGIFDNTNAKRHILADSPQRNSDNVIFSIDVNGKEVYSSPPLSSAKPGMPLEIPVNGGDRLTLVTRLERPEKNFAPWSVWCDAKVE